jgi:hypothetical protein
VFNVTISPSDPTGDLRALYVNLDLALASTILGPTACLSTTVVNPGGGAFDVCGGGVSAVTSGTSISGGGAVNVCFAGNRKGCDWGFEIGSSGSGGNVFRTTAITVCNPQITGVNNVDSLGLFAQGVGAAGVSVKEFATLTNC